MRIDELRTKRAEFKLRVLEYLNEPSVMSYREIGDLVGISPWRVCQIRKEFGLPNRVGGHRTGKALNRRLKSGDRNRGIAEDSSTNEDRL